MCSQASGFKSPRNESRVLSLMSAVPVNSGTGLADDAPSEVKEACGAHQGAELKERC